MTTQSAIRLLERLHPRQAHHAPLMLESLERPRAGAGATLDMTAEEYARCLAGKWGRHPFDGPFSTVNQRWFHQQRFRDLAAESLMVLREAESHEQNEGSDDQSH